MEKPIIAAVAFHWNQDHSRGVWRPVDRDGVGQQPYWERYDSLMLDAGCTSIMMQCRLASNGVALQMLHHLDALAANPELTAFPIISVESFHGLPTKGLMGSDRKERNATRQEVDRFANWLWDNYFKFYPMDRWALRDDRPVIVAWAVPGSRHAAPLFLRRVGRRLKERFGGLRPWWCVSHHWPSQRHVDAQHQLFSSIDYYVRDGRVATLKPGRWHLSKERSLYMPRDGGVHWVGATTAAATDTNDGLIDTWLIESGTELTEGTHIVPCDPESHLEVQPPEAHPEDSWGSREDMYLASLRVAVDSIQ